MKPIFRTFHTCEHCGQAFSNFYSASKYCSDTCRMAAAHQRRQLADPRRDMTTGEKRTHTLSENRVNVTCEHCGTHYLMNGNTAKGRQYCSNACKQAAYRERKKHRTH